MTDHIVALFTFVVFALSFVPFIKWYLKRAEFVKLVEKIPGPKAYPLIGSMYLFYGVKRKDIFKRVQEIRAIYPEIRRIWSGPIPQVELLRAEHIEDLLSSGKHHLEKSWIYEFIRLWLGDGLLISNGEKWFSHRKIITPTFHFSILDNFCEIFAEKSDIFIDKLRPHCDTGVPVNIHPFITKVTMDIIAEAAMGTEINAQDGESLEYVNAVHDCTELLASRMLSPWVHPEFIYKRTKNGKKFAKCLKILHEFTNGVIQQRKEKLRSNGPVRMNEEDILLGKKKRLAFLDLLLETNENGVVELSDQDIREEVDTFMFEGHDTTTSGILWTLFLLGLHPQIQEDVYTELESIFHGSSRPATVNDFSKMKLLDRVIKESLRLYPPVPIIGRTLSEDIHLDKYKLPAGLNVTVEIIHLHRDERYFPDPEKFDPDRFLPENTLDRHPYAYIPFSAGTRNCIGQKFASYEEKSILSSMIRNYRFKSRDKRDEVIPAIELVLRPVDGIWLTIEKRH